MQLWLPLLAKDESPLRQLSYLIMKYGAFLAQDTVTTVVRVKKLLDIKSLLPSFSGLAVVFMTFPPHAKQSCCCKYVWVTLLNVYTPLFVCET